MVFNYLINLTVNYPTITLPSGNNCRQRSISFKMFIVSRKMQTGRRESWGTNSIGCTGLEKKREVVTCFWILFGPQAGESLEEVRLSTEISWGWVAGCDSDLVSFLCMWEHWRVDRQVAVEDGLTASLVSFFQEGAARRLTRKESSGAAPEVSLLGVLQDWATWIQATEGPGRREWVVSRVRNHPGKQNQNQSVRKTKEVSKCSDLE